ncbi:uncharacterized protein F5Z01DRAFT_175200 [Emericellopsis atlantica]|uniref:Uncharacterized protein n=1 Tax=Emericellopsis atlantica TaxID=2614577 RepID=A0A9P7ZJX9_9HYPO|nr:uncharacterized protein F5Z01DRAFT_175200 [Emericellopsis atlantica]KAG9253117.1 hypothetical protein F5Z01DRAFT_175200 [Emericellopsis atlantica]
MSTTNKFQAGESYGEARKKSSSSFLSDPVRVASDLFKDYATLRSEASLTEVVGLIKGIMNEGEPIDDKKGY